MGMTSTERSRVHYARIKARGGALRSVHLSAPALAALERLEQQFGCNSQDVVEGLLLGNINPREAHAMAEHGLSLAEIDAGRMLGINF